MLLNCKANKIVQTLKEILIRTDFIWAQAMGYEGAQYDESDGLSVGTADKPTFEYKYLEGRCRHYKLVGNNY